MTGKADFTQEEWKTLLEAPPSAGLIVATAQRGGALRESLSMAKAYAEARKQHGASELLDEIVSAKPEIDHTRFGSVEELMERGLVHLEDAIEVLKRKATPDEVDEYRRFVLSVSDSVANAHREGLLGLSGERVSDSERTAIDRVAEALGTAVPQ